MLFSTAGALTGVSRFFGTRAPWPVAEKLTPRPEYTMVRIDAEEDASGTIRTVVNRVPA